MRLATYFSLYVGTLFAGTSVLGSGTSSEWIAESGVYVLGLISLGVVVVPLARVFDRKNFGPTAYLLIPAFGFALAVVGSVLELRAGLAEVEFAPRDHSSKFLSLLLALAERPKQFGLLLLCAGGLILMASFGRKLGRERLEGWIPGGCTVVLSLCVLRAEVLTTECLRGYALMPSEAVVLPVEAARNAWVVVLVTVLVVGTAMIFSWQRFSTIRPAWGLLALCVLLVIGEHQLRGSWVNGLYEKFVDATEAELPWSVRAETAWSLENATHSCEMPRHFRKLDSRGVQDCSAGFSIVARDRSSRVGQIIEQLKREKACLVQIRVRSFQREQPVFSGLSKLDEVIRFEASLPSAKHIMFIREDAIAKPRGAAGDDIVVLVGKRQVSLHYRDVRRHVVADKNGGIDRGGLENARQSLLELASDAAIVVHAGESTLQRLIDVFDALDGPEDLFWSSTANPVGELVPNVVGRPMSQIRRKIMRERDGIGACHKAELIRNSESSGAVLLRWSVAPNGRVSRVAVAQNTIDGEHLGRCLAALVKSWTFPAADKFSEISYPFIFETN